MKDIRVDGPILVLTKPDHAHKALLKERGGTRKITVELNCFYNICIDKAIKDTEVPEQTAHRLLISCISTLAANIEKVVIYDCTEDGEYFAYIYVRNEASNQQLPVSAKVCDALVVATLEKCAIFVKEEVFEKSVAIKKQFQESVLREQAISEFIHLDPRKNQKM